MTALRFRVTGRVQGVGFRHYTQEVAWNMGLVGEVWNSRDGSVEGVVQGERLDAFLAVLRNGPGHVEDVTTEPTSLGEFAEFGIAVTR